MIDVDLEEIMAELAQHDPCCLFCDTLMTTPTQWATAGPVERMELRADGYREPGRRGLCRECYVSTPKADMPPSQVAGMKVDSAHRARMAAIIKNRDEMVANGWTAEDACFWLGVDANTVAVAARRMMEEAA